jgi:hypothetical protein
LRQIAAWPTWPAVCMTVNAISISQLVLNEIAWSPGDPGTGAPTPYKINALALHLAAVAAVIGDSQFKPSGSAVNHWKCLGADVSKLSATLAQATRTTFGSLPRTQLSDSDH